MAHKPYWEEWFKGQTDLFLGVKAKRCLIVGPGGLDATLLGAVEAGKFTSCSFDNVGHTIHEDKPDHVAQAIKGFLDQSRIPADCN